MEKLGKRLTRLDVVREEAKPFRVWHDEKLIFNDEEDGEPDNGKLLVCLGKSR